MLLVDGCGIPLSLIVTGALQATWRQDVRPTLSSKTAAKIELLARDQYGEVTDVLRAASRIPQDRTLVPERLQARCEYGLLEILRD